ncbi:MAG: SDR family oxidoreductase [Clostridium sp.]
MKETGKKLDGFVHCAGNCQSNTVKSSVKANVIQDIFAVNYVSFMELMKHFAKKTNSDGGSVVAFISPLMLITPRNV